MFLRIALTWVVLLATASGMAWGAEPPQPPEPPESQPQKAVEAEKPDAKGLEFFEAKIRPILANNCYKCHSAQAGKAEGSLQVDSREAIRAGGDRGAAIVPGDPDASILLTAIRHSDSDLQMPPKKEKLSEAVLKDFESWIRMGAPDPRERSAKGIASTKMDLEAGRKFWAFQKPVPHEPPAVKDTAWPKRDLDRFVLARLEANGLASSPDAKPTVFLRRLHFDLVGLPPSPTAVARFLKRIEADGFDRALEVEVDELLALPQFGERWGRHWLDVARFAESSGKEANMSFPYAWRYRDYVIDCLNADVPFDRFLMEQIAGDLLPYESDDERARLLIATGFLAVGPKNLNEMNAKQFEADVVDEQIDSVTRAVMASSVACARCHDHKFDPYAMQDYYALAGVFGSTKTYFGTAITPINQVGGDPLVLPRIEGMKILQKSLSPEQVAKLKSDAAVLRAERDEMDAAWVAIQKAVAAGEEPPPLKREYTITDALRVFWGLGRIEGELKKVDDHGQALPLAMGVLDRAEIADAPRFERGDVAKPAEIVPRAFPRVIDLADAPEIPADHSGRLEFARWLTHPDHPLTARVMVNRVWHHLFGTGLVRTVDNFGTTGEPPSHPELLDQLTVGFVADGWSVKQLVRELVLSRTYRQASDYREAAFRADPDNRLLWRASKRRLDAEALRDTMLVVSGELDSSRPVGSLVAQRIDDGPIALVGLNTSLPPDLDGSLHRSVYLPILRDRLPDVLDLFDFAEPGLVTGSRDTTNVPVQALYLMNSPFVQARAQALARRLTRETKDHKERVRQAYLLCFGREPAPDEVKMATGYLKKGFESAGDDKVLRQKVFISYCQALFSTAEFRNLD